MAEKSAVVEKSAAPLKVGDVPTAGIYQFTLRKDGLMKSVNTVDLPVYSRRYDGTDRVFLLTVTRGETVYPLGCHETGCGHQWEPERPLLPGVLLSMPGNERFRDRFYNSFFCPRCREKGKKSRGRRVAANGAPSIGVTVPSSYYLTADDHARLIEVMRPDREGTPIFDEITLPDGKKTTVQHGQTGGPIKVCVKVEDGIKTFVHVSEIVVVTGPIPENELVSPKMPLDYAARQHRLLSVIKQLNAQVAIVDDNKTSNDVRERAQKKVTELSAELAKIMNNA